MCYNLKRQSELDLKLMPVQYRVYITRSVFFSTVRLDSAEARVDSMLIQSIISLS